jgi:hypothetical protein
MHVLAARLKGERSVRDVTKDLPQRFDDRLGVGF